jgi:hypothetical protein
MGTVGGGRQEGGVRPPWPPLRARPETEERNLPLQSRPPPAPSSRTDLPPPPSAATRFSATDHKRRRRGRRSKPMDISYGRTNGQLAIYHALMKCRRVSAARSRRQRKARTALAPTPPAPLHRLGGLPLSRRPLRRHPLYVPPFSTYRPSWWRL